MNNDTANKIKMLCETCRLEVIVSKNEYTFEEMTDMLHVRSELHSRYGNSVSLSNSLRNKCSSNLILFAFPLKCLNYYLLNIFISSKLFKKQIIFLYSNV
jgi:hypothetical protein